MKLITGGPRLGHTSAAMPAYAVKDFKHTSKWVLISIIDPVLSETQRPKSNRAADVLNLTFDDVLMPKDNELAFDDDHADQILDFVERHRDEPTLFAVHCEQGARRSPAVAAVIDRIFGADDKGWFEVRMPNRRVYEMLYARAIARGLLPPL